MAAGPLYINNLKGGQIRKFIEGVWYIARCGCQGRLIPENHSSWRPIHEQFKGGADYGISERLFVNVQYSPDFDYIMNDATLIRAHACSFRLSQRQATSRSVRRQ